MGQFSSDRVRLTLAGVWGSSVLTELEEEQWDPVFVSDPDTRRFLDSGELDIWDTNTHVLILDLLS